MKDFYIMDRILMKLEFRIVIWRLWNEGPLSTTCIFKVEYPEEFFLIKFPKFIFTHVEINGNR